VERNEGPWPEQERNKLPLRGERKHNRQREKGAQGRSCVHSRICYLKERQNFGMKFPQLESLKGTREKKRGHSKRGTSKTTSGILKHCARHYKKKTPKPDGKAGREQRGNQDVKTREPRVLGPTKPFSHKVQRKNLAQHKKGYKGLAKPARQ